MTVDLVIKHANMFIDGTIVNGGMAIEDGRIVAIAKEPNLPKAEMVIDAGENLVLPGLVDVHVHFRDPGFTHKEDFGTGSFTAAAGGVTTVVDEPNNIPVTTSVEALDQKVEIAREKSIIDFTFSFGMNSGNLDLIPKILSRGIVSFDIFGGGFGGELSIGDPWTVVEALERIREVGGLTCLTNGEPGLSKFYREIAQKADPKDIIAYCSSSPGIGEAIGASRNILLSEAVGVKVHLRQISSVNAVDILRKLESQGRKVTSEVSPHHLLLTTEDAKNLGPYGKVGPPIRSKVDTEAVWSAFADGTIDILATDHAPHTREEKEKGNEDIWKAAPGLPGIETMLPLMLTQVNEKRLSLKRLVEASSELPSKVFGLYPRKGAIRIGSDADLVIIDINSSGVIRGKNLHSKIDWTPFEGWKTRGQPIMTLVRGVKVMEEKEIVGEPGHGDQVKVL